MEKLRVFESFAGVGSYRMALDNINCNYEVVAISEVDKYALVCYDAIHNKQVEVPQVSKEEILKEITDKHIAYDFTTGESKIPRSKKDLKALYNAHIRSKNLGDIRLIKDMPDFDLFLISSPCKTISICGKKTGFKRDSGTESSLLWECERIIKEKKPKYILLENVKNIVGEQNIGTFNEWCKVLEDIGYVNHWSVLNGSDFNVPQGRERMMMFSVLKEYDNGKDMPTGTPTELRITDILEDNVDEQFIVPREFTEKFLENCIKDDISYDTPKTVRLGGIFDTENSRRQAGSVYSSSNIAPTLDTMQGGYRQPIIPIDINREYNLRRLTPLECWRLMGYKDEHFYKCMKKGISNSRLYERAGRGIVVPMLEEIFKTYLSEYIMED